MELLKDGAVFGFIVNREILSVSCSAAPLTPSQQFCRYLIPDMSGLLSLGSHNRPADCAISRGIRH